MTDLNPEQVRYWRTFPYGPQVPRADFRALADSWLAQREALAAAQRLKRIAWLVRQDKFGEARELATKFFNDEGALASLSNNNTND